MLLALIATVGEVATLVGLCTSAGAATGPFLSLHPKIELSAGEASGWGASAGFILALILVAVLPTGFAK